jgi:magnesium transporter
MAGFETLRIDEKIIGQVKGYVQNKEIHTLQKLIDEMLPADLADLIEHLESEERMYIFRLLEPEGAADVLVEIEAPVQEQIVSGLDNQVVSDIVQELDSDDAADLVGDLPDDRAREIIDTVEETVSEDLEKLLSYREDTAGGIMALEFVAVKAEATVQESIEAIRKKREEVDNLYYLFVVDDLDRLLGVVSLKDLVLESPQSNIQKIMNPEVISAHVNMDQEDVYHLFKKYDIVSLPVVDDRNRLVGRITHDDIIDVIEEEGDQDTALMAGVSTHEITEDSPPKISRARLPWLIAALFGEIFAAMVISQFETSLEKIIALSCFFPVIMAMGGNTGTQAATVAVRGLATGDISLLNIRRRISVEMKVALINGMICGTLLGVITGYWFSNYGLGATVALSLVLIILNAGIVGAAVPLMLKKFNIDPALASGPFVSTSNDIMGLFIYLGLVTLFLKFGG